MHVGREPKSTAYRCDPYQLCSADRLELILKDFPDLNICVPHLGFDELLAYRKMIEKYEIIINNCFKWILFILLVQLNASCHIKQFNGRKHVAIKVTTAIEESFDKGGSHN